MKKEKKITIRLSEQDLERIEKIAKKAGVPKSRLIRNFITAGLEDAELFNKLGLIDIAKAINELKEKLSKTGINLQNA